MPESLTQHGVKPIVIGGEVLGVDLSVEPRFAGVGQSVQSAAQSLEHAVPSEFLTAFAGISRRRDTGPVDRLRGEVSVAIKSFEDRIIRGPHPVPALSHTASIACYSQRHVGVSSFTVHYTSIKPHSYVGAFYYRLPTTYLASFAG